MIRHKASDDENRGISKVKEKMLGKLGQLIIMIFIC